MFCTECGAKIEDGAKFCTKCGSPVDFTSQDMGWEQPDEASTQGHPSRKPFPMIAVIGIAAGVVLLFAVVFILLRKPSGDEPAFVGVGDDESEEEEKTKKTGGTKEADAEWKEEYLDGVNKFKKWMDDDFEYYSIVDIDNNGIPEIFVKVADCDDKVVMFYDDYSMGESYISKRVFLDNEELKVLYGDGYFFAFGGDYYSVDSSLSISTIDNDDFYLCCSEFDRVGYPKPLQKQQNEETGENGYYVNDKYVSEDVYYSESEAIKYGLTMNKLEFIKGDFDDLSDAIRNYDSDASEFLSYASLFKKIGVEWIDEYMTALSGSAVKGYVIIDTDDDGIPEVYTEDIDSGEIGIYHVFYDEDYDRYVYNITYSAYDNFNDVDLYDFINGDIFDLVDAIKNYDYNPDDVDPSYE